MNQYKFKFLVPWHKDRDSSALDIFSFISLVSRVLQNIFGNKANGIVVVPSWFTQPWLQMFTSLLIRKSLSLVAEILWSRDCVKWICQSHPISYSTIENIFQATGLFIPITLFTFFSVCNLLNFLTMHFDRSASFGTQNSYGTENSQI